MLFDFLTLPHHFCQKQKNSASSYSAEKIGCRLTVSFWFNASYHWCMLWNIYIFWCR